MSKKGYLALINANHQMQTEGYEVPDLWCIFHYGKTYDQALLNALSRRAYTKISDYTIVEDTPENRLKYGNPQAV